MTSPYLAHLMGGLGAEALADARRQQDQGYRERLDANLLWKMQQQARYAHSPFGPSVPKPHPRLKPPRLIDMSGPEAVAHMLADSRHRLCAPYKPQLRELTR